MIIMKGKNVKKICNIGVVLVLMLGGLAPFLLFTSPAKAEAIPGIQVIGLDYFDGDGDGLISPEGKDDIGIKWRVDKAPVTIYIRIKSGLSTYRYSKYYSHTCNASIRWCNEVMTEIFGSKNTMKVWYGSKLSGYCEISFNLPKRVEEFPIDFTVKNNKNIKTCSYLLGRMVSQFPILQRLLNFPRIMTMEKILKL